MRLLPRLLRAVADPLGLYVRPSPVDHRFLIDFLAETAPLTLKGVVFDSRLDSLQSDLRAEVQARGIESIVDLRAMELATIGGFGTSQQLPWCLGRPDTTSDFTSDRLVTFVASVSEWILERKFSAVLAPTHFLAKGESDPWLQIDLTLTHRLRDALDAAGAQDTLIYYPLAIRPEDFFHVVERDKLRAALSSAPIDALWPRIHRFGANSGAQALRRFIRTCGELHQSGRPIVPESCGIAGLALLGFGAAGAITTGITTGDQFDFARLKRRREDGGGGFAAPRIYISELQSFLSRKRAGPFFERRLAQSYYACKNDSCCKRGVHDMLADPRRHYLKTRLDEIARLSALPESLRPDGYLDQFLRPATDLMVKAANAEPSLHKARSRLDSWRTTLSAILAEERPVTFSSAPNGRRILLRRGA